jgi:hypothetical protein
VGLRSVAQVAVAPDLAVLADHPAVMPAAPS